MLKSDKFSCICLLAKYLSCYEDESEKNVLPDSGNINVLFS